MSWTDPVYDRAQSDIDNRTAKAFMNVADWLRIYGNSEFANQITNTYLALSIPFNTIAEPDTTHFPTITEINDLVENIELCRAASYFPAAIGDAALESFEEGVGGNAPDYTDINDWERDLELIVKYLTNGTYSVIHCGVGNCGQTRLWQVRFRVWPFVQPAASPVRRPRGSLAICGSGLMRQNKWRRYS